MGMVTNVSRAGLAVQTPEQFFSGEQVLVRVAAGDRLHDIAGCVRRCDQTDNGVWELGIEFDPHAAGGLEFLTEFLPCTLVRPA